MSNFLTGDFDGVLEISGGTINRLLATMHQNAFSNPNVPSFPHAIGLRIGDDQAVQGVRGFVQAQLGVPRVELIDGATDRFHLELGVRAWYRPDGGSKPLPGFIHGTVRAEYRIENIDPSCLGWGPRASQYLWIRVVPDSVRFQGTMAEDRSGPGAIIEASASNAATEATNITRIETQIAVLLARRFEATPHPIKPGFRRDLMRSLNRSTSSPAVAVALDLGRGAPAGGVASVNTSFLENADIGFGVSLEYLLSLAQPLLDQVSTFKETFPVHVDLPLKDFDTVYRVSLEPATIEWEPHDWYGILRVKVRGSATTNSVAANATFDVEQNVILQFDAGGGAIVATAASPGVKANASGLYNGTVAARTSSEVFNAVKVIAANAVNQIQPTLNALSARSAPLLDQLKSLDPKADLRFTEASFLRDGIVIRGVVSLSARQAPVVQQAVLTSGDGHSALESWMPGGRIDSLEWSWTWTATSTPGGKATHEDRFILRRPAAARSRWGVSLTGEVQIPGLDGWGTLCLTLKGVHVDPVSGALVPVESIRKCKRFGLNISDHVGASDKRLFLYDASELAKNVPVPLLSVMGVGDTHVASAAANTLVMFASERWHEDASVLREGLERCGRYDAGLTVLILFGEGVLSAPGSRVIAEVEAVTRRAGIAAIVNADVHGSWSRALEVRASGEAPRWALISPRGAVTWRHEGHVSSDTLGSALDTFLHQSPDASPAARTRTSLEVGDQVIIGLDPSVFFSQSKCPPFVLGRGTTTESVVTFVERSAPSSRTHLRQLYADYGQSPEKAPFVVVVVDGADANEAESLKNELGIDFVMVGDPAGTIADRHGVDTWPTTITLDGASTVSAIKTGVRVRPDPHCEPPAAE